MTFILTFFALKIIDYDIMCNGWKTLQTKSIISQCHHEKLTIDFSNELNDIACDFSMEFASKNCPFSSKLKRKDEINVAFHCESACCDVMIKMIYNSNSLRVHSIAEPVPVCMHSKPNSFGLMFFLLRKLHLYIERIYYIENLLLFSCSLPYSLTGFVAVAAKNVSSVTFPEKKKDNNGIS